MHSIALVVVLLGLVELISKNSFHVLKKMKEKVRVLMGISKGKTIAPPGSKLVFEFVGRSKQAGKTHF